MSQGVWSDSNERSAWRLIQSRPGLQLLAVLAGCTFLPGGAIAVLAPAIGLGPAVAVGIGLAVLVGGGLALLYIKGRVLPISALANRARRIGAGDLDGPIESPGRGELGELSRAFDEMSAQLEDRFFNQERVAEIDREILASVDTPSLAQTVLDLVPDAYPCRAVSLTVAGAQNDATATSWVDLGVGERGSRRSMSETELTPEDRLHLARHPEWVELRSEQPLGGYLAHLESGAGDEEGVIVFPLHQGGELAGALAVRDDPAQRSAERIRRLRQVADRVAVALANARMVDQVRVLAFFDNLTRLPNRVLYQERLGQAIGRASAAGTRVAVCSIDVDHFGRINDTLGPGLGDQLIQAVGRRLSEICEPGEPGQGKRRDEDGVPVWADAAGVQVARLGGDEFAMILPDLIDPEEPLRLARRVQMALQHPFKLGTQEVFVTASIGIAVHPEDGQDPATLHQNSDVALAQAKKEGRNAIERYSTSMNAEAATRMRLEHELRKAVEQGEFTLWYQPVVDLRSRWATGAEALVRWDHPDRGLITPGEFIQLCEESGLIVPLGEWSLWSVCTQARRWAEAGYTGLRVSVNLSARQLRQRGIVRTVQDILDETGAKPQQLAIELTESLLMEQGGMVEKRLRELAELGISLAIDDFGTGYSSLSYLKNFPVSTLKIDRSFIVDVTTDPDAAAITTAIIALAKAMELEVVAEGVETKEQADFLKWRGCEKAQGYLLGRPAPVEMFTEYLKARQRRKASA